MFSSMCQCFWPVCCMPTKFCVTGKKKASTSLIASFLFGLVFTVFALAYITGTNIQRRIRIPVRWEALSNVAESAESVIKPVPTQEDMERMQQIMRPVQFKDEQHHHDDDTDAKKLAEKIRVLCWVMTSPENLDKKARHVKNTWGKRCNILLFMSSIRNESFPAVGLNISEGREHLTAKTMLAFRYVYETYFDKADWFMKTDDDTYVIVENLRYFLSGESPADPIFFGHHFKRKSNDEYVSGGAGYIVSKEALKRFGEKGKTRSICRKDGGSEDIEFGQCIQRLGVRIGNSTDNLGRSRFHCFDPETHLQGYFPDWYKTYDFYGANKGQESMSDYAISFHYVSPQKMYALEYYTYHLRPYGISSRAQDLNQKREKT